MNMSIKITVAQLYAEAVSLCQAAADTVETTR